MVGYHNGEAFKKVIVFELKWAILPLLRKYTHKHWTMLTGKDKEANVMFVLYKM